MKSSLWFKEPSKVIREAYHEDTDREDLITPKETKSITDMDAVDLAAYSKALDSHIEKCNAFYESQECKEDMVFLMFFIKDFFALNGVQIKILRDRVKSGDKKTVIAKDLGISRGTLYLYLNQ